MDENTIGIIIYIVIALIVVIFTIKYYCDKFRYRKLVMKYGKNINKLFPINSKYLFYPIYNNNVKINFSAYSKRNLELTDEEDVVLNYIANNYNCLCTDLKNLRENRKIYYNYLTEINSLNYCLDDDFFIKNKIKQEKFYAIEKDLIRRNMYRDIYYINAYVYMYYVSPQGRNAYSKTRNFSTYELLHLLYLYEQNLANQNIARAERAKMSLSLRYDILRRDGFRCQLCGAKASDGVTLHVDHIYPVSKGGRTVPSNLRTLCDKCNLGKSDKIE